MQPSPSVGICTQRSGVWASGIGSFRDVPAAGPPNSKRSWIIWTAAPPNGDGNGNIYEETPSAPLVCPDYGHGLGFSFLLALQAILFTLPRPSHGKFASHAYYFARIYSRFFIEAPGYPTAATTILFAPLAWFVRIWIPPSRDMGFGISMGLEWYPNISLPLQGPRSRIFFSKQK